MPPAEVLISLTPLAVALLAALAGALCTASMGVRALGWLKVLSRRPRHRAGKQLPVHQISVGGVL